MTDEWLTKEQTAAVLSCSGKSVERYQSQGLLEHQRRAQPGTPPIVVFSSQSVEALRTRQKKPPVVLPVSATVAARIAPAALFAPGGELAKHLAGISSFAQALTDKHSSPVYVSLTQAARLTGLSKACLKQQAQEGKIKAMPFGTGKRYRRADLEAL